MATLNRRHFKRKRGQIERTTAGAIARMTLADQIIELRSQGYSVAEIANMLSEDDSSELTPERVRYLCQRRLETRNQATVEEFRQLCQEQLDRVKNRMIRLALSETAKDRVAAAGQVVTIIARQSALLGADAPKQLEVKNDEAPNPATTAIADFVAQLAQEARDEIARASAGVPGDNLG